MNEMWLMACGATSTSAFIAALVLLRRKITASGRSSLAAAQAIDDYRRQRDKADLDLICPVCQHLAEPMADMHDRYRCVGCRHQFAADPHEWTTEQAKQSDDRR